MRDDPITDPTLLFSFSNGSASNPEPPPTAVFHAVRYSYINGCAHCDAHRERARAVRYPGTVLYSPDGRDIHTHLDASAFPHPWAVQGK